MFFGRESELRILNDLYKQPKFQMPVIYGRRRVGKTRLIQEFCRGKRAIFYVAIEQNDLEALRMFTEVIKQSFPEDETLSYIDTFSNWEGAFLYIAKKSKEERVILVIDEYPYLANTNKSLPSLLQKIIDLEIKETELFLILCGSSMSFMENEVLNYKSPLYGRRTAQIKLHPLDYADSISFFQNWPKNEQLYGYAVAGGIPQYLLEMSRFNNFKEAVIHTCLTTGGTLYEEPMNLMKQEMREPAIYNSIIRAIAQGSTRQNEISNSIHVEPNKTANYLKALLDLEIIGKQYPLGEKNSKKVIYKLKDNLFKFWYRFIPRALPMVEMGLSEEAFDGLVIPDFEGYFGYIFEEIAEQYLIRKNKAKQLNHLYQEFGKWWGTNKEKKKQEEIDIVACNDKTALFAECKWQNSEVGLDIYTTLVRRSELTQQGKEKEYYLFSKSGYSKGLRDRKIQHLSMVQIDDLFTIK